MPRSQTNLTTMPQGDAETLLFCRLFDHMCRVPPLVPVTQHVIYMVESWAEKMIAGRPLTECYGTWGIIYTGIEWSRKRNAGGAVYGANLLQFMGHVGEVLQRYGTLAIPLKTLLYVLIDLQPDVAVLVYGSDEDSSWIEPTDHGSVVLGLIGKLSLPYSVPCFDVPQEFFEQVYGSPSCGGV